MIGRLRRSAAHKLPEHPNRSAGTSSSTGGARLRTLGDILLIAGGLILSYPLWSAAYAQIQQARLDADYRQTTVRFAGAGQAVSRTPSRIPESEALRILATAYAGSLNSGDAIGRLKIPSIDLDRLIQQGVSGPAALDPDADRPLLRRGLVHYAVTPLPGAGEPFAVAGHRTTYGAPFGRLDTLRAGDAVYVETPYAKFRYAVVKKTVVKPSDVSVLLDRGYGLVLTTCTPPYSASHRLVVWASLRAAKPRQSVDPGRP